MIMIIILSFLYFVFSGIIYFAEVAAAREEAAVAQAARLAARLRELGENPDML